MINISELRIGNIVAIQLNYDGVSYDECEVTEITLEYLHHTLPAGGGTTSKWDDVDPIIITPEWLQRMGFKKSADDNWVIQVGNLLYIEIDKDFDLYINPETWNGAMIAPWAEIEYVHQLQNLYFTLTGKEIEIKN